MQYRVDPRDVPREKAARRLGMKLAEFDAVYPNLLARGFPTPDPDTEMFDLIAIDQFFVPEFTHYGIFGCSRTPGASPLRNSIPSASSVT